MLLFACCFSNLSMVSMTSLPMKIIFNRVQDNIIIEYNWVHWQFYMWKFITGKKITLGLYLILCICVFRKLLTYCQKHDLFWHYWIQVTKKNLLSLSVKKCCILLVPSCFPTNCTLFSNHMRQGEHPEYLCCTGIEWGSHLALLCDPGHLPALIFSLVSSIYLIRLL